MKNIKSLIRRHEEELIEIRRRIHQYPELSFKEYKTTKLIKDQFKNTNVEILPLEMETGVFGILKGKKEGPDTVTALRADIDALPVQEQTGLDYSSKNDGIMHACGHDGNTTVVLGAAKVLSSLTDKFSGIVKFIFQPAEETLSGAKAMVKEGVLENPKVDNILGIHAWPDIGLGKIGIWEGPYMASADKFTVKLSGSGAHGAYPHKSVDPVLSSANAIVQFQNIISRKIDALDNAVISVCTLNGGKAFNVIPEEVEFSGTVRCQNEALREIIENEMEKILKGIAVSSGCSYELNYEYGVPPVINNSEIIDLVSKTTEQILNADSVENLEKRAMSSEDFSIYLKEIPRGALIRLGIKESEESQMNLHNDNFNFNDKAIIPGVSILVQYVLNQNN